MGISFAPSMCAVSNSQGSRTSTRVNSSPASSLSFTSSGVISYSIWSRGPARDLLPRPLGLALLEERLDSLLCVPGLHQFFQINLLRPRQPLIEVHGIPGVPRFLAPRQRRRIEFEQISNALIDGARQFCNRYGSIRQSKLRR